MKKWYVIQAKPREEDRVTFFLRDKDVEIYSPRMEICTMAGVKRVMLRKPLFPNYIFARFDVDKDLFRVSWTKGVQKVLPESVRPIPLDEEIIKSIKSLAGKDNVVRKRNFKKNDRIRVSRGPMKDNLGIFENWASDTGRVRVLLDMLNYQARLELHHSLIEKIA
ncbi:MAG: transcription termination/antitermination NusG family protein [Deltaproteobacteria bacterium]|nr:transcription termination/antitermination NusG family protein [Deltaproteobacteria bacterium]